MILIGIGDLQIIAENLIVLDFQIFDTGLVPLLGLQLCQPALALGLGLPETIHILMIAVLDDAAVPDRQMGGSSMNRPVDHGLQTSVQRRPDPSRSSQQQRRRKALPADVLNGGHHPREDPEGNHDPGDSRSDN